MAEIRVNATGELKLFDSDDSNYVSFKSAGTVSSNVAWTLPSADGSSGQMLSTNGSGTLSWATASSADPTSADGDTLGTASAEWSDLYLADSSVIYFGNDQDTTLTHTDGTGLTLNSTNKICFNDASQFIQGSSNAILALGATDEIDLTATAIDINGTCDISGTFSLGGTNITSTAAEINLIDGGTARGTTALADGDGILINDAGTMRMTNVTAVKTYMTPTLFGAGVTDVLMDATNFTDGFLIQTNSNGSAPSTGTLNGANKNIGIGIDVFAALTEGDNNICFGEGTGKAITTGYTNVIIGMDAGQAITTGYENICIGAGAGGGFTTTNRCIAIGRNANDVSDDETNNIAIGYNALGGSVAGGEENVIIGNGTGLAITSGDRNVLVGDENGDEITTGFENVFVGEGIGGLTTGRGNIVLGRGSGIDDGDGSFRIGFGCDPITLAEDNNLYFGKSGNVVSNDFSSDANWSRSSDVRKKRNIHDQELGLDFINDLRTVRFQWKPSNEFPKEWYDYHEENTMDLDVTMHGLIAQEVKEALDKHASENDKKFSGWREGKDGMQHTSREMYVIPLIKAVQELTARVKELEDK